MIPIYKPYLTDENTKYAIDAIKSGWISSQGEYLNLIKDPLKKLSGCEYIVLTNNGTTACHLMALGLKYKYPKIKKIIIPNNCFVAAYSQLLVNPIYELIPVDCDHLTWNVDENKLDKEINKNDPEDTAIMVVHNIGNIVNVPALKRKYPDWVFIEDNCEGFLGEYENQPSGSVSLMSAVSFFGNKTLTGGESGALFTNDFDLFSYLNVTRSHGLSVTPYVFKNLGYNYRMTNVQAAILLGQLESLEFIKTQKARVFEKYKSFFSGHHYLKTSQVENFGTKHSNWMFAAYLSDAAQLSHILYDNDIQTRRAFPPITYHGYLKHLKHDCRTAEDVYNNVLMLPSYPELHNNQIEAICDVIKKNRSWISFG